MQFSVLRNKFLSIGRNKGFRSNVEISKNLSMKISFIDKIKKIILNKKILLTLFVIFVFLIIALSQL